MQETVPLSPNSSAPASPPADSHSCSTPGGCGKCLKGGLPLRHELVTFLALAMLATSVVLGIMLLQSKRDVLTAQRASGSGTSQTAASLPDTLTQKAAARQYSTIIPLPKPKQSSTVSVERALAERRSRRVYTEQKLSLSELSQMLWAGQGITDPKTGKKTAPSSRETYFYTLFVVIRSVEGVEPGLYEYLPAQHALGRRELAGAGDALTAAGVQDAAQKAPAVILLAAEFGKGYATMKDKAPISAYLEAGHIGQNLYLEAESLKLGMVVMGGFDSAKVIQGLKLDPAFTITYVAPFGHPGVEVVEKK